MKGRRADGYQQTIKLAQDHPDMLEPLKTCIQLASKNDGKIPVLAIQAAGVTQQQVELLTEYGLLE